MTAVSSTQESGRTGSDVSSDTEPVPVCQYCNAPWSEGHGKECEQRRRKRRRIDRGKTQRTGPRKSGQTSAAKHSHRPKQANNMQMVTAGAASAQLDSNTPVGQAIVVKPHPGPGRRSRSNSADTVAYPSSDDSDSQGNEDDGVHTQASLTPTSSMIGVGDSQPWALVHSKHAPSEESSDPDPPPSAHPENAVAIEDGYGNQLYYIPCGEERRQTTASRAGVTLDTLSPEQRAIIETAKDRMTNIFITGSGGVGKSVVTSVLIHELRGMKRKVAVTASTGMAAVAIGGHTIHSWAKIGYGDGKVGAYIGRHMYLGFRSPIVQADVLIVDEISMLNSELFMKLDILCRKVRGRFKGKDPFEFAAKDQPRDVKMLDESCWDPDRPFGGLQVIVVGDFFQLRPVKGSYVFTCPAWKNAIHRTFHLDKVFRQEDEFFVNILGCVRHGEISPAVLDVINSRADVGLIHPPDIIPTKLYAVNKDVDSINASELAYLDDKIKVFEHEDSWENDDAQVRFSREEISKLTRVPEKVMLKVGAQVMVTKNFPNQLAVNGSRGVVLGYRVAKSDDMYPYEGTSGNSFAMPRGVSPVIKLMNGRTLLIPMAKFDVVVDNRKVAMRKQIPLRLAWALTIHKSQGMSLDLVECCVSNTFASGQAYVALSRCRSLDGLALVGHFTPNETADRQVLSDMARDQDLHRYKQIAANLSQDARFDLCMQKGVLGRKLGKAQHTYKAALSQLAVHRNHTLVLMKHLVDLLQVALPDNPDLRPELDQIQEQIRRSTLDQEQQVATDRRSTAMAVLSPLELKKISEMPLQETRDAVKKGLQKIVMEGNRSKALIKLEASVTKQYQELIEKFDQVARDMLTNPGLTNAVATHSRPTPHHGTGSIHQHSHTGPNGNPSLTSHHHHHHQGSKASATRAPHMVEDIDISPLKQVEAIRRRAARHRVPPARQPVPRPGPAPTPQQGGGAGYNTPAQSFTPLTASSIPSSSTTHVANPTADSSSQSSSQRQIVPLAFSKVSTAVTEQQCQGAQPPVFLLVHGGETRTPASQPLSAGKGKGKRMTRTPALKWRSKSNIT